MQRREAVIAASAFVYGILLAVAFSALPSWWRTTSMVDWIPVSWLGWVLLFSLLGALFCLGLILYLTFAPGGRKASTDCSSVAESNRELASLLRIYLESQGIIPKK